MKFFFAIILFLSPFISLTQITLYQDIWNGSVKCTGFSTGASGQGIETVDLSIPSGSTIKQVFFVTYSFFDPDSTLIELNDYKLEWDSLSLISELYFPLYSSPMKIHFSEVTSYMNLSSLNLTEVSIKNKCGLTTTGCGVFASHFFVLCENFNDSLISFSLSIADKPILNDETYNLENLNPINSNKEVAFSVYLDRSLENIQDGSFININSNNLGYIYGEDIQNLDYFLSGVQGNFVYRNELIFGLNDDLPDFSMSHHDALSNIQTIIPNGTMGFELNIKHNFPNSPGWANFQIAFPLAYSTDCNFINGIASKDTIICKGESVQLSASGGVNYEWQPQADLSCTNCPNPIFSGDSSQLYTVRIWANDTCSVVRPVMVKVRQQPQTTSYFQSNTLCGDSTASINWQNLGTNEYSLDNSTFQNSGIFNLIGSGDHTLTVRDSYGCEFDTLVSIDSYTTVNSNLTATPTTGEKPLLVEFIESNSNDDGFWWNINGSVFSSSLTDYNFTNSGTYFVSLIAFQNDSTCTDTSTVTIVVTGAGSLFFPQFVSANNDGSNDTFEILGLENFPNNHIVIFNRWGNEVFEMENYDNSWMGEYANGIGKDNELPTGTYFYIFEAEGLEEPVHSFIWLVK